MAHNGNIITAPVSILDVQSVLGTSNPNLDVLCKSERINMWAKWKPIKAPVIGLMTSEIMRTTAGVYRYGIKRNAGSIPLWNPSTGELTHDVWTYDRPTGGSSSPYRLADFANWDAHANPGYYHNAPCPVRVAFPDPAEITVTDNTTGITMGFVFTFQNGIIGWRTDGTCLSVDDIFGNDQNYYLTVGLLRYDNGVMKQYYMSSDSKLSDMSAQNPVAYVIVDTNDFRSKIGSNYLVDGQKWNAILFLSGTKCTGQTDLTGNIVMLEYEQNADRKEMTVVRTSWAQNFGTVTLQTVLTKNGTWRYRVQKSGGYGISVTVQRDDTSGSLTMNVKYQLICVGGTIGNGGSQVTIDLGQTISFAAGESTKTLNVESFTGYDFIFQEQASVKRAIVNVTLTRSASTGSISLATETDCSTQASSYTTTNSNQY
jgi:hypothetical protein